MRRYLLLFGAASMLLFSCSSSTTESAAPSGETAASSDAPKGSSAKDMILGTWKFENMDPGEMSEMLGDPTVKEAWDKQIADMRAKSYVTLSSDGTFKSMSMLMGELKEGTGKWFLADDGKTVSMEDVISHEMNGSRIEELTATKLVLSGSDGTSEWRVEYRR